MAANHPQKKPRPQNGSFLTAFVFGDRAAASVRTSGVPESIVTALDAARVYPEGRGIRLETRDPRDLAVMKQLAAIKMAR